MMETRTPEKIVDVNVDGTFVVKTDAGELCRLCANMDNQLIPLFQGEGLEHNLSLIIERHLPIIKVTEADKLPLQICHKCASTLISWHNLYESCPVADKRLREIIDDFDDDTPVNLPTETPSTSNSESNTFKDNPTEIPTLSETKSLIHETELEESDYESCPVADKRLREIIDDFDDDTPVNLPTETPSTSNLESNTFKDNPTEIPTLSETKSLIHETELEESDYESCPVADKRLREIIDDFDDDTPVNLPTETTSTSNLESNTFKDNPTEIPTLSETKSLIHETELEESDERVHITPLLIKNGTVVNADKTEEMDVYLEDGIIKQLGRNMRIPDGTRIIDAKGMYIIPGGIDAHTRLEFEIMGETSVDDFYTGTKAAIVGGTTTILDLAIPQKDESLIKTYKKYRALADGEVCCDYGLHMGVTAWNKSVKQEIMDLCKEYGVNSFKIFLAYEDFDEEMYHVFETCKELGAIAMVHAENGTRIKENTEILLKVGITGPEGHELSRPEEVEAEAVVTACVFANQVECPLYVCHLMSKSAANVLVTKRREITESRMKNKLFGETHVAAVGTYLKPEIFSSIQNAANHILAPPLRRDPSTPTDGLQVVSSDNCTFNEEQKAVGLKDFTKIPNGVNGIEDRMSIVWEKGVTTGILTLEQFVAVTSTNAAKIFNIYPKKGCISVGADADIVIWNPKKMREISWKSHYQAVEYNIFEGTVCHGVADYVIVKGRICVEEAEVVKPTLSRGLGEFLQTPVYSPFVYPDAVPNEKSNQIRSPKSTQQNTESRLNVRRCHDKNRKAREPQATVTKDNDQKPTLSSPSTTTTSATKNVVFKTTDDIATFQTKFITKFGKNVIRFDEIDDDFVVIIKNLEIARLETFVRILNDTPLLQKNVDALITVFFYIQSKRMNIFMAFPQKGEQKKSNPPARSNECVHFSLYSESCDCINSLLAIIDKLMVEYRKLLNRKIITEEILQDQRMMFLTHSMLLDGELINPRTCATELLALKSAYNIRWNAIKVADLKSINKILSPNFEGLRSEDIKDSSYIKAAFVPGETDFLIRNVIPEIRKSDVHPVIKATGILGRFLKIRPFLQNNNRTGRMLFNSFLSTFKYPSIVFPYHKHDEFMARIDILCKNANFAPLQKLVCEAILNSIVTILIKVDCDSEVLTEATSYLSN